MALDKITLDTPVVREDITEATIIRVELGTVVDPATLAVSLDHVEIKVLIGEVERDIYLYGEDIKTLSVSDLSELPNIVKGKINNKGEIVP